MADSGLVGTDAALESTPKVPTLDEPKIFGSISQSLLPVAIGKDHVRSYCATSAVSVAALTG